MILVRVQRNVLRVCFARKLSADFPSWIADSSSSTYSRSTSSQSGDSSDSDSDSNSTGVEAAPQDDSSSTGFCLADLKILEHIICLACICRIRRNSTLVAKETKRAGLASVISITCCTDGCDLYLEHPLVPQSNPYFYECNRRSVSAARTIGRGHSGLQRFCGMMDLPPPVTKAAFQRHQRKLYTAAKTAAEDSTQKAVKKVKDFNPQEEQDQLITAVTFDGTWMKRGFTSFHGVFTCIDWNVGPVLDLHVSTKYCQSCR